MAVHGTIRFEVNWSGGIVVVCAVVEGFDGQIVEEVGGADADVGVAETWW